MKVDNAICDGVPSEIELLDRMGAMKYYRLLSMHIEKVEEIEKQMKEAGRKNK